MSKDQLKILFPNKREKIEGLSNGKISLDNLDKETQPHIQVLDYPEQTQDNLKEDERTLEPVFDVVEYYYKKPVTKHLVVSLATGDIIETDDEQTANQKAELLNKEAAIQGKPPETRVITRVIPEIWVAKMVGNSEIMVNEISWTYPKYKGYPFIPFKAHWVNTKMTKKQELTVQGLTRSLKDPQIEHNKRRTQELRHLNQSANSGWMLEENSIKNPESIKEFGASPGVNIVVKEGKPFPQKIVPTPLSQGHAQLAAENAQDMKEISGINTDLLASQEGGTDSGRAIFLRQQQGLVMVQRVMDNFKHSKRILGRFLLTMLGKVYSLEETMKILGENFIQKNFSVEPPPEQDPATGTPIPQDPVVDMSAVKQTIITILEESENLKKYDVEIGEAKSSITMRLTNLAIMQDMVAAGLPIPPDVLIDQSLLDNATKEKVKQSIQQAQQAQAQQGAQ